MEIKYDCLKNYLTASGFDNLYYDPLQCNIPITTGKKSVDEQKKDKNYRGLWIGVGDKSENKQRYATLSAQFSFVKYPPGLSCKKRTLARQLRTAIQILREEEACDQLVDKEDMHQQQFAEKNVSKMMECEKFKTITASVQNISKYMDDFKLNKVRKEDIPELIANALIWIFY